MPWIDSERLSRPDAEAFRNVFAGQAEVALAELSHWLVESSGPWQEMDASLDSLLPLWPWFVRFVDEDCPGVPRTAVSLAKPPNEGEPRIELRPIAYVAEAIGHYVMLVCRDIDPAAKWDIETNAHYMGYQKTGIRLSNGILFSPHGGLVTCVWRVMTAKEHNSRLPQPPGDDWLRKIVANQLKRMVPRRQKRRASVLPPPRPTPDPPPVLWRPTTPDPWLRDTTVFSPQAAVERAATAARMQGPEAISEELLILKGDPAAAERPGRLPSLPTDVVSGELTRLGFGRGEMMNSGGRRVDFWDYRGDTFQVSVTTTSVKGTIRLIGAQFEGDLQGNEVRAVFNSFAELSRRLGARLITSDAPD